MNKKDFGILVLSFSTAIFFYLWFIGIYTMGVEQYLCSDKLNQSYDEYNDLINKYNSLVDEYNTLWDNCSDLINKYNGLVDEYNNLYNSQPTNEWEQLLIDFANSHSYNLYNYNCVDYSRDAVEMLREHGYDAYQVQGHCKNMSSNHAWVEICLWYEPQTGELIDKDECFINM